MSVFSVNQRNGALTVVPGSPFTDYSAPNAVAFSPGGRLLFVVNGGSANVSVFSVNQLTGMLSAVPGSPFAAGPQPLSVAASPSGLLATVNEFSSVSVFSVHQATGALSAVPGSPFADYAPNAVAFSPGGGLLATTSGVAPGIVSVFSVNQATGALSAAPGSPFMAGAVPTSLAFSSSGLLATPNVNGDKVSVFSVNQRTGALSEIPGSPFATGRLPISVAFAPNGRLLAVANGRSDTVSMFSTAVGRPSPPRPSNQFTLSHVKTQADGTLTFSVKLPGPGSVDVLETAWDDNLATIALLQPAAGRFVFARMHTTSSGADTIRVLVRPNARGRLLVRHHTYRVTLRLWVSYTPTAGLTRSIGLFGLHLPSCRDADHDTDRDLPAVS